jgi:thiamine biosynthesis lipoprotein
MKYSFNALGTTWWIEIFDHTESETLDSVFNDIECFVSDFEKKYSRFKADSNISILNTQRTFKNPDDHLRALLSYGKNLYVRTNTHFNILTGHILEARGYDADYSFLPKDESLLVPGNPISDLIITPEVIELVRGNIDIGGYGKGYLIDEVADRLLQKHELKYFIINAGGDIFATSNQNQPIEIYLEHPQLKNTLLQKTSLFHQGFAASSPFKRKWKAPDGSVFNHLVHTKTQSEIATFVKAKTACEADVFATTAMLTPPLEMQQLVQTEQLAIAFYDPETKQLTSNRSFFSPKITL